MCSFELQRLHDESHGLSKIITINGFCITAYQRRLLRLASAAGFSIAGLHGEGCVSETDDDDDDDVSEFSKPVSYNVRHHVTVIGRRSSLRHGSREFHRTYWYVLWIFIPYLITFCSIKQFIWTSFEDPLLSVSPPCLGGAVVGCRTRDRKVAGSTPGRGAIKSTRTTQPSA